jgi:UDP-glucose 4-epimerase
MAYWDEHKVPVVIARLFNTIGPRQTGRYGMVVPRFVEQALSGEPITVYGDGQQSRCFSYVGDLVRILAKLATFPEAVGEIINVGNDEEITVLGLARQVKAQTKSTSDIVFVPYDIAYASGFDDMQRRVPDLRKLDRLLSDRPRTTLRQSLEFVIDYARAQREAASQLARPNTTAR